MLTAAIRSKVDRLWNHLYSGGLSNPLSAMEQISYLLFMRRLDASDRDAAARAKFRGEPFTSVFANDPKCRWSEWRHYAPEPMLDHVRDVVFPFIKRLGGESAHFSKYMADAVFLIPTAGVLARAVAITDEIYEEIEREQREQGQTFHDTQGDLYEYLLSEISSAGKNGQFRTPRHIIQMIVELVDPQLGESVADLACGTAGFLLGAWQHILTQHTSPERRHVDENGFTRGLDGDLLRDPAQWQVLRERTLYGFDIDRTMVRIGLMNLLLHGLDRPNLRYADTLSKRYDEADRYRVVLANPPFKGSIDKSDMSERLRVPGTKSELLFVDRIIDVLELGGRAGVIVPDGVLFGSSKAHVQLRKMLLEECELRAVVSMPAGVFKPYAGVSTAAIVFVKGGRTKNVWFYDMTADGYSLDDKREKVTETDLPDVIARYRARDPERDTDRTQKAFFVPLEEIVENKYDLSINRYKQVVHEEVAYDAPRVILAKLKALDAEIAADVVKLEGML